MELPVANIDRDHIGRARLQEAIGEAPCRRADVETVTASGVYTEVGESTCQLVAAARHEAPLLTAHADLGVFCDPRARLVHGAVVYQNPTREDQRLRPRARLYEPQCNQALIESRPAAACGPPFDFVRLTRGEASRGLTARFACRTPFRPHL